ncbi:MAG: DNA alkylation repair protein [Acidimicrobiales bacterium]
MPTPSWRWPTPCGESPSASAPTCGTDLLVRQQRHQRPRHLSAVERLIVTSSWWDTVDALAANAGPLVLLAGPAAPDRWIADDDLWLRRTALLRQLRAGPCRRRSPVRLLRALRPRAQFFIRKAIGWALRQHARTDAAAVEAFVARMGDRLSPLAP